MISSFSANHNSNEINHVLVFVIIILIIIFTVTLNSLNIFDINTTDNDSSGDSNKIEHYDLQIKDITEVDCGTRCTEALNCSAFAYKPIDKVCYLSKTGIIGRPIDSVYGEDYSKLDRRCSKSNRITDSNRIDGLTLTKNSVYMCSDGESNTATRFQYANLGASALEDVRTSIFSRGDIDTTTPTDVSYNTMYINWPRERKEEESIYPSPLYDIPNTTPSDKIVKSYGFIESDKEFLGQYMLAHQCVANVPFYDCIKYCENNAACAGVEWNKSLVKRADDGETNYLYENVCCPKAIIKQIIPRRKEFDRGKFYVKKELNDISGRDRIILSKSDLGSNGDADTDTTIPVNNKFNLKMTDLDINKDGMNDVDSLNEYKLQATQGIPDDIYVYHTE
jgi:hypothetical protein